MLCEPHHEILLFRIFVVRFYYNPCKIRVYNYEYIFDDKSAVISIKIKKGLHICTESSLVASGALS